MFFSDKLLRLGEGNFSVIWLLGNNICDSLEGQPELGESDFDDRKKKKKAKKEPTRREIMATDVSRMCKEILEFLPIADEHMAFRLTSVLLIGVVDCHIRQVHGVAILSPIADRGWDLSIFSVHAIKTKLYSRLFLSIRGHPVAVRRSPNPTRPSETPQDGQAVLHQCARATGMLVSFGGASHGLGGRLRGAQVGAV